MSKENFEKALEFLFPSEGGYVNNRYDKGGATNMGITQYTYNIYRKRLGLPQKNVKEITLEEAKNIYYNDYWRISGADNISDPNLAVALFDTAVLHGPGTAKAFYNQSGGNLDKFLDIRQQSYDKIVANDPTQKIFYNGWNNRVNNLRNSINSNKFQTSPISKKDFKANLDGNRNKYFTPEEIGKMTPEEFRQNEVAIMEQLRNGQIRQRYVNYDTYKNPKTDIIFTREDISKMSTDEYSKYEKEINTQLKAIGIPYKRDLPEKTKTYSKEKSSQNYTSKDGKWVTINGNHVFIEK